MQNLTKSVKLSVICAVLLASCILVPLSLHAQTSAQTSAQASAQSDLSSTIRSAILKDPRAASLTSAEIDAMVAALTTQAQSQGLTPQAIAYRSGAPVAALGPDAFSGGTCLDISSPLCALGQAFGFENPNDYSVPIGLWVTSGLLLAIIWHMRKNPHLTEAPKPIG